MNDINDKIEEIIDYIKNTKSYNDYLKLKNILESDENLMNEINKIKKYQQSIVKNPSMKKELELKIEESLNILNNSPTYVLYLNCLDDINNMLMVFENKVNKYFTDLFD